MNARRTLICSHRTLIPRNAEVLRISLCRTSELNERTVTAVDFNYLQFVFHWPSITIHRMWPVSSIPTLYLLFGANQINSPSCFSMLTWNRLIPVCLYFGESNRSRISDLVIWFLTISPARSCKVSATRLAGPHCDEWRIIHEAGIKIRAINVMAAKVNLFEIWGNVSLVPTRN